MKTIIKDFLEDNKCRDNRVKDILNVKEIHKCYYIALQSLLTMEIDMNIIIKICCNQTCMYITCI